MFYSLFGSRKFLFKVLPVYQLNSSFQYNQTINILKTFHQNEGSIKEVLCDNNKVNQNFF